MNKKQLTLVIVLGLVIGGAGLYKYNQRQMPEKDAKMGAKLLGNFDVNAVAAVRIQNSSTVVNLAKTGDIWTVKERGDYPANFNTLAELVRKLADLKIVKPVQAGPSRLPVLELVSPEKKGPGAGVLVELKDSAGKPVKSLLLGAKHMGEGRGGGPMGGDGGWPNGRYVMVDGKQDSIALISDALTQAEPKAEDWINKDFVKVEKLKAISVASTNATNNWKLVRETESGEWKLADAKGDEKADNSKCSGLNSLLQYAAFNDVATSWKFDETNKPTTTAVLETFDGFTYTAKAANKSGDDYYFQVSVAADLPKERTTGKDEKKEDKDKLDKEFKEKNQKLQDKLKTEQGYSKWTYVVSKWTVDNLLKERKEFLAEKKEEPKKDEPKKEEPPKLEAKPAAKAETK
ncbi:MAG: DUF4340 domain-containing protein [Verrucomicrobia bacterium]|nr:DUF4340 domain-containing protein [Verrucomicrobiota bacterium]